MTTISLTMDQLCALILAAQDGVLPQQRTARQERNRRYYEACKRRRAGCTAPAASTATPASAVTDDRAAAPVFDSAPSASDESVSGTLQMHSDAVQTVSDAGPSDVSPSPSLPPSPPSPGPPSSAPTHAPPSAAAPAHVKGGRKVRQPRQPKQKRVKRAAKKAAQTATACQGDRQDGARRQEAQTCADGQNPGTTVPPESDETWLRQLEQCEAFRDIPLRDEYRRMVRWSTRHDMRITRSSFLEWLKRYERPLKLPEDIFAPPVADRGGFFAGTVVAQMPHLFQSSTMQQ